MWKELILYRFLEMVTSDAESLKSAATFLDCLPATTSCSKDERYKTVYYSGFLKKENGTWVLEHGLGHISLIITSSTKMIGFQKVDQLFESVHVLTRIKQQAIGNSFGVSQESAITNAQAADIILSNTAYHTVNTLSSFDLKYQAFCEYLSLMEDQKTTVYRFMTNEVFAKNMIRCLGFMASAKIDPWFCCSDRNDDLIEQFNDTMKPVNKIDVYRVLSFLDIVGDELLLSENSATIHFPPNWLSFLGIYALTEGCSVWSIPEKSLTQTILKDVPHSFFVPSYMLCWILSPVQQNAMMKDLLKCKAKKKQKDIRTRLIHLLHYGSRLKLKEIHSVLRHLMEGGLTDEELDTLLSGNCATVVKSFLLSEYGLDTV